MREQRRGSLNLAKEGGGEGGWMDEGVGRGVMHKMMRKRRKSRRRRMRPSWDPLGVILETSWGPLGPLDVVVQGLGAPTPR